MTTVPQLKLDDGTTIPQLGFGVFQVPPAQAATVVTEALGVGYRAIDTAAAYRNEEGVGLAIARSGIPRADLHITTKLWNSDQGYDSTLRAFDASMTRLGLDHLDLYLIHWPAPRRGQYVATWKALLQLKADGRVSSVGVSNFQVPHLERLHEETGVYPVINQVELHPRLPQTALREFHAAHGIATQAWSPLARGELLGDPLLAGLAARYGKTTAQVILRWHLQLGNVVIPKSVTPSRIAENFAVFDFELAPEDITAINTLATGARIGPHPDEFA